MVTSGTVKPVLLLAFIGMMIIGMVQPIAAVGQDSSSGQCERDSQNIQKCEESSSGQMSKQDAINKEECEESDKEYCPTQEDIDCANYSMKEAIKLHEMHMKNPDMVTNESQMEMMDDMIKCYECLAGENLTVETTMEKMTMDCEESSENKSIMKGESSDSSMDCKKDLVNETVMTDDHSNNGTMMHHCMMHCMMNCMKGENSENKTMMMEDHSDNETMMHCMCMMEDHSANETMMHHCMMEDHSANETMMHQCMMKEHEGNKSCLMAEMDQNISSGEVDLECASLWLKEAIELHAMHMQYPSTSTEESNMVLMFQMSRAYACITGKHMMAMEMMNAAADGEMSERMNKTADEDKFAEWLNSKTDNESAEWMKMAVDDGSARKDKTAKNEY